ncbi:MAG TPA: HU family DNA-binding protein [bacterium]|nr:HU family DNA-binding protein [bacterium]
MTQAQFAARLAERLKTSKAEAHRVVETTIGLITTALKKRDPIRFVGFGVFRVSHRKARTARNPQTGAPVNVPARTVPRFTASKDLKEAVKRA